MSPDVILAVFAVLAVSAFVAAFYLTATSGPQN